MGAFSLILVQFSEFNLDELFKVENYFISLILVQFSEFNLDDLFKVENYFISRVP